jgi:DNA repair ATPase RecN
VDEFEKDALISALQFRTAKQHERIVELQEQLEEQSKGLLAVIDGRLDELERRLEPLRRIVETHADLILSVDAYRTAIREYRANHNNPDVREAVQRAYRTLWRVIGEAPLPGPKGCPECRGEGVHKMSCSRRAET